MTLQKSNEIVEFLRTYIGKKPDESASPFTKWLGGEFVEISPGNVVVRFVVRREMTNPTGILHGGVHAAIMDDCIGLAVLTLAEKGFALTVDLHLDYLGRVDEGEIVYAHAGVERNGRKIVNAVCELKNEEGRVISRGSTNLVKTGYGKPFPEESD